MDGPHATAPHHGAYHRWLILLQIHHHPAQVWKCQMCRHEIKYGYVAVVAAFIQTIIQCGSSWLVHNAANS